MPRKLIFLLCLSFLSSCSNNRETIGVSEKFFNAFDRQDYMTAYNMLSPADRSCMSADSFCAMSARMEDQIARLDSSSAVSTFIERTDRDSCWVRQVWRVPDYALINKAKPQNVSFSEYFSRMEREKAVPLRLDSSRVVCLIKDHGGIVIYIGLDRLRKFAESYRYIMGSYSFMVIVVPKMIEVRKVGRTNYSADASVRVTNYSPFLVSGFVCSISIDRNSYDSTCEAFAMTNVPAGQSVVGSVRLSEKLFLLRKYLSNGALSGRIEGNRITIIPTHVFFGNDALAFMRKYSMRESGFAGFTYLAPGYSKPLLEF